MIPGIDVNHWHFIEDGAAVAAAGYQFAIAKATEAGVWMAGSYELDPRFEQNYHLTKENGMIPGAFMMFKEDADGPYQASLFMDYVEEITGGKLKFWGLDVERNQGVANAVSAHKLQQVIYTVYKRWRHLPAFIYTSRSKWEELVTVYSTPPLWTPQIPLWMAYYGDEDTAWEDDYENLAYNIPEGWLYPHFWQYSQRSTVPGVNPPTDLNWFFGSEYELKVLAGLEPQLHERVTHHGEVIRNQRARLETLESYHQAELLVEGPETNLSGFAVEDG